MNNVEQGTGMNNEDSRRENTIACRSRRQFVRAGGVLGLGACLSLYGCNGFKPAKFATGEPVSPPYGCTQLRQQREDADC